MIKILYIIDKMKRAGAQVHLSEVIRFLDKTRFEIALITLEDLGIKRIYDFEGIKGFFRLVKIMKKERFDIIHSYLFSENIISPLAAKLAGIPVVITSRRDTGALCQGKWQHILAYRFTNRWLDKIVCVSEAVKRVVLGKERVNPEKVEVVYNGVDVKKFSELAGGRVSGLKESLGIKENEYVVGMIANFSWIKGHKDFIEAIPLILQEVPNTKFLLIGDGILRSNIENAIRNTQYAIREKVLFLGSRQDIPELLSIMDVSVNASYSEGMSNTVLESMAAGVPVVATAVDGNLETVVDGETGILVPPKNPMAMSAAIIKILKDKELARKMSENAKKVIREKFSSEIMVSNMEGVYRQLLRQKIAFIFSQFPCYDETFIMREMNQLRENALNFDIYSIKRCQDKIIHSETKWLIKDTYYLPFLSLKVIFINLFYLIFYPIRYLIVFIQVFCNNIKSPNFFIKSICLFPQAVGFAWQARKDKIIHVHGQWATYPATYAYVISRLNNIPFSFTGHAHDIYLDTTGLREKIERAEFVLTCTAYNKSYLVNLVSGLASYRVSGLKEELANKICVSYHGVDLEKFKNNSRANELMSLRANMPFRILSVGSLLPCKGFDILIDACKILRDKGVDFECTIAGGGPLEQELRSRAQELKSLGAKIQFTGYITQDELIPLYQQADVFALPVRSEIHWGIPNVLLEAMATGTPVITVALPSTSELIDDGKTGFIVPEESPKALADKLILLAKNPELRKQISEAGYSIIKDKFDIQKNTLQIKEVFEKALEEESRTAKTRGNKLTVLTYHSITNERPDKYIKVSADNFRRQMEFLKNHSYNSISLDEAYKFIKYGEEIPPKSILITFDDGYKDNYVNAYPILKQFGFKAGIFLIADKIDRDYEYLNAEEIKEMAQNGIDFGSHTLSHPNMCQVNSQELKNELAASKRKLEELTNKPVDFFCYPKGYFNHNVKSLVKESGYRGAFSVIPGKSHPGDDLYEIKRIGIGNKDNLWAFAFKLSPAYEFLRKIITNNRPMTYELRATSYNGRINVLYIIWSLGLGGAERVVINLTKGLDKAKYNPMVCCLNDKGVFAAELEDAGIKVIALNKRRGMDISVIGKIIKVIKENKIDIVHTHMWGANLWGRIAAKLAKVPVIIATEQNVDNWKKGYHFVLDRWLSGYTSKIIAVSQSVKEFYVNKGLPAGRIEVIYNSIELAGSRVSGLASLRVKEEFGIENDEKVLAVIGRLVEQKGHRYLFEALSHLDGKYKIKLLVVGDGQLRKELELSAISYQLSAKIIFTGLRKDIKEILGITDILVLPSLREGLPLVALEAMTAGVPVVATRVGGTPEVVIDGKTGKLVEPKDGLALKEAIIQVIENRDFTQQMINNARKLVEEKFNLTNMLKKTQGLYEELYYKKVKLCS